MYDLYDLFPLHDLDLSPFKADLFKILSYDTAHAAGWDRYNLHDLAPTCFLIWICTMQILHNLSTAGTR